MVKSLILGMLIIGISFPVLSLSLAQEANPLASPSPEPVKYALPYPGLLPDHPLYPLKILRDTILSWLMTNPVRRVEFQILQADKHLNSAVFLAEKDKDKLAVAAVEKAVSWLKRAEIDIFQIPATAKSSHNNLNERLEMSLKAHLETINALVTKVDDADFNNRLTQLTKETTKLLEEFSRKK